MNRIGSVIVSVVDSSAVDRGFEPSSDQTKDYEIGICCFSTKNAALRSKTSGWLARNEYNVSKWRDMSTHGLPFQLTSAIQIQLSVLVWYRAGIII
jgi:hypothetical protein